MNKKVDTIINIVAIIVAILIILIPTTLKIIKTNRDRLHLVTNKRIIEAYQSCVKRYVCDDEKTTLNYLMENGFLQKEINPVTKEYYNLDSYVIKDNNEYKFIVVE